MTGTYRRYLLILLATFCVAWPVFAGGRALYNISVCRLAGYSFAQNYVAFCFDKHYGDFEHEAFYDGMFDTGRSLRESDVLFLGDSRVQYAFAQPNMAPFFAARRSRFFIAAFGYGEGWEFTTALLKRHRPSPKILVINVSPFFLGNIEKSPVNMVSQAARYVMDNPIAAAVDAHIRGAVQPIYAAICPGCGKVLTVMRSRETGQWETESFNPVHTVGGHPLATTDWPKEEWLRKWSDAAEPQVKQLLAAAPARCVVLTDTPWNGPVGAYAKALSARFNVTVIIPELAGLRTHDTMHLDAQSATEWSDAFLEQLDRIGPQCGAW